MNDIEVSELLAKVSALDPYAPAGDERVLKIWTATLHDIPAAFAVQVLVNHYRNTRETIAPADIVGAYRRQRQDAGDRRIAVEAREARKAIAAAQHDPDPAAKAMRTLAAAKAVRRGMNPQQAMREATDSVAARRELLAQPCPHCLAQPGIACSRPTRKGGRTPLADVHPSRRNAQDTKVFSH